MGMKRKLAGLVLLATAGVVFSACGFAATTIPSSSGSPATITFNATNPATSPTDSGSSASTITFTTKGGSHARAWTVQVEATSANFGGGCPSTVPVTQVIVTCGSAIVGGGGGGTGGCSGPFNLSTAFQTVASGTESTTNGATYTVTINFTFTDSWAYLPYASACTAPLSYTITAN